MARVVAIGGEPDFAQYLQTTPKWLLLESGRSNVY